MVLALETVDGGGDIGRQGVEAFLAHGRQQRPQLRTGQECRLMVDRHQLVEDQHQRDRDEADTHCSERGAAEAVAAVAAARRAFDEGPWPRMREAERAEVLRRLADLLDAHAARAEPARGG